MRGVVIGPMTGLAQPPPPAQHPSHLLDKSRPRIRRIGKLFRPDRKGFRYALGASRQLIA